MCLPSALQSTEGRGNPCACPSPPNQPTLRAGLVPALCPPINLTARRAWPCACPLPSNQRTVGAVTLCLPSALQSTDGRGRPRACPVALQSTVTAGAALVPALCPPINRRLVPPSCLPSALQSTDGWCQPSSLPSALQSAVRRGRPCACPQPSNQRKVGAGESACPLPLPKPCRTFSATAGMNSPPYYSHPKCGLHPAIWPDLTFRRQMYILRWNFHADVSSLSAANSANLPRQKQRRTENPAMPKTTMQSFGTSARIGHDSSAFYGRKMYEDSRGG